MIKDEISQFALSDMMILQALSCLKDHLKNHPSREGNSVGYRIEQAIFLLKQAQSELLKS